MKRHANLWPRVTDFANLLQAAQQAQKGKRFQRNVLAFNAEREQNLLHLQAALRDKSYMPGGYRTFEIYEPKKRTISAAPYRDRVVHHALCNVIGPIFERGFIPDSYANRKGFGTHRALKRFTRFARTSHYVLQCDVQKYFPAIDHEILKKQLRRKIKCPDTLWLMDTIIDRSNPQLPVYHYFPGDDLLTPVERRRGLPVGNLTSQFFANIYLDGFDHFIKEQLRIRRYIRYVDDFALFSDTREELAAARTALEDYLAGLRLKIHPVKSQLFRTRYGANFLGFRVLPERIRLRAAGLRRTRSALDKMEKDYRRGKITLEQISRAMQSRAAHLAHADTWRLRQILFARPLFVRQ